MHGLLTLWLSAFNIHVHKETNRKSPDPSFPMHDTETDPRWGWLGLACETSLVPRPSHIRHLQYTILQKFCTASDERAKAWEQG